MPENKQVIRACAIADQLIQDGTQKNMRHVHDLAVNCTREANVPGGTTPTRVLNWQHGTAQQSDE
jgi:hypothetical protein